MKIRVERIEDKIVTCKIEGDSDSLIDVARTYLPPDIKVGDIVDAKFEHQSIKDIPPYSVYLENFLEENR